MKRNFIAAEIAAVLLLAACTVAPETELIDTSYEAVSESVSSENVTMTVSEGSAVTDITSKDTEIAAETAVTEESADADITSEDTEITAETTRTEEVSVPETPDESDLKAYITEDFESAHPLSYEMIEMSDVSAIDSETLSIGAKAVKASEFYAPVISQAKELLVYENGVHVPSAAGEEHFLTEDYLRFFNGEGSSEFDFEPLLVYGANAEFDGENMGSLIVFQIPLTFDVLEWSGTGTFFVSVYVSSEGNASVLYDACNQTLFSAPMLIKYSDNKCHYCFNMGHTDGTSSFTIYSFDGDVPSSDVHMYCCTMHGSDDSMLRSENMAGWGNTFFRDGERNCYCILKGAATSPEFRDHLSAVPGLAEKYPALMEDTDVDIRVYGGKIIAVDGIGFVLDSNGIAEYGAFIGPDEDNTLPVINADIGGN